jgi:hypothetical protein
LFVHAYFHNFHNTLSATTSRRATHNSLNPAITLAQSLVRACTGGSNAGDGGGVGAGADAGALRAAQALLTRSASVGGGGGGGDALLAATPTLHFPRSVNTYLTQYAGAGASPFAYVVPFFLAPFFGAVAAWGVYVFLHWNELSFRTQPYTVFVRLPKPRMRV